MSEELVITDLDDFSDERVLEVLIQFYANVHQHVLNINVATSRKVAQMYVKCKIV